ncbi:ribose import ATP-binding protein RbsA [Treponema primitia ZAS-2]|uniref:Ribose import ATP-binding protein RbsA n=1 Tax=Treponema primitia (strain ATCC BAA-887 / DSM 12427 / ZAS-2) TaxID=545694 RepID=F5YMA0_TREPZ|nr:sugar ABC transporter ATP-binding protein [Treponema primitia]AEF84753.1 ribose import ATP-binding protein RbsA [Treponema primitia ZAS-2]
MADNTIFKLAGISKRFPGVIALDSVDLEIKAGEVHGLVGENGAGKSTLIKIITGAHAPDEGDIFFNGQKLGSINPHYSMSLGIACIYQELNQIPHMTVAENIYLGREKLRTKFLSIINRDEMKKRSREVLSSLGLDIDPALNVGALGVGRQQMVEIARAVQAEARLIIMDEPTASLSARESEELLRITRFLKEKGVSVIYISHRLDEVKAICDRITILRDGKTVTTVNNADITIDEMVKGMVGRDIAQKYPKLKVPLGKELLRAEHLTRKGVFEDVSFVIHSGEVVGFAGLVGAGRTETVRALTGADPLDSGKVFVDGKEVHIRNPRDSIQAGIAFLTEDRKAQGLILIQDIEFNSTIVNLRKYVKHIFLNLKAAKADAEKMVQELRTRTPTVTMPAGNLSGGNQQKVVIAKWLLSKAKIFIIDEPTRGIDVGAKVEVYNLINQLVKDGAAVLMISSEMDECIGMSDRIVVMHEGHVTAELSGDKVTQENVMYAASGIAEQEKGSA